MGTDPKPKLKSKPGFGQFGLIDLSLWTTLSPNNPWTQAVWGSFVWAPDTLTPLQGSVGLCPGCPHITWKLCKHVTSMLVSLLSNIGVLGAMPTATGKWHKSIEGNANVTSGGGAQWHLELVQTRLVWAYFWSQRFSSEATQFTNPEWAFQVHSHLYIWMGSEWHSVTTERLQAIFKGGTLNCANKLQTRISHGGTTSSENWMRCHEIL